MHQKYGITVCDAFISFVCGREEEGTRSIVSAIKVVKINKDGFNGTLATVAV